MTNGFIDYYRQNKKTDARAFAAISRPEVEEIKEIK
jgi:hypothetical protein